ncbi:MAG TPA: hypothetical protein VK947_00020 [Planococcus sp. (in: firmicutes)]|nr:hypothetical protein [Planococcus sp. (in: firmicutes)]
MVQNKWLKLGAASFLSLGMLAACGDNEDQPEVDIDTDMDTEMNTDEEVDTHMDPDLDEDTEADE